MCCVVIGRPTRPFRRGDERLYNFASNSAFAERALVTAVQVVRIPEDILLVPPPPSSAVPS
ncbi:Alcohol dehydrogenase OS=Streptomyces antimycoticus OX=68175 GN=SANT12839_056460 PE=3 SV=1 [Streptomyces antimycoticus]